MRNPFERESVALSLVDPPRERLNSLGPEALSGYQQLKSIYVSS